MRNIQFQSTLLQEERLTSFERNWEALRISIHAPTRGATSFRSVLYLNHSHFNPRSYKRSDDRWIREVFNACEFQSTLLQEERQSQLANCCCETRISIHAPTRGATGCYFFVLKFPKISIHAPTRGATLPIIRDILFSAYFNPRSYKRSDSPSLFALSTIFHFNPRSYKRSDLYIIINIICCVISIHAPTRGATKTNTHHHQTQHYFNPRSYKRSDIVFFASVLESSVFQSTLLQEERPGLLCTDHRSLEFQSTLLQEERPKC